MGSQTAMRDKKTSVRVRYPFGVVTVLTTIGMNPSRTRHKPVIGS